jgi:hypothetical protein
MHESIVLILVPVLLLQKRLLVASGWHTTMEATPNTILISLRQFLQPVQIINQFQYLAFQFEENVSMDPVLRRPCVSTSRKTSHKIVPTSKFICSTAPSS